MEEKQQELCGDVTEQTSDAYDYDMERIQFLVNAAYANDDRSGKSFSMAIGLIQGVLDGRV